MASKPLGNWFETEGRHLDTGSPLDRMFLTSLLCLGLLVLILKKDVLKEFSWSSAIRDNYWLMLLLGYMLISVFWSEIPFISFKRWIKELLAVVMAFLLLTEASPRQAFESVCRRVIYILLPFSLLLIKYFPVYGRDYDRWKGLEMWMGVTLQKNGLGRLCFISVFFLVWSLVSRRQGREISAVKYQNHIEVFLIILALYLLKGPSRTYPATAVVALVAGLIGYALLLWMKKHKTSYNKLPYAAFIATGITFGMVTVFIGGSNLGSITSSLGRSSTLTGRTEIWAALLPTALKRPILGHGFGGFWTSKTEALYIITESHNGYLDVLLHLGFVGLLLLSLFLVSSSRKAQNEMTNDFHWASLRVCFLVMAVIHNVTESSFNSLASHLMALLVFLAIASSAPSPYYAKISDTHLGTGQG